MAADWTHLHRDASTLGGLLTWPVEAPEGQDLYLDLPGVLTDDEHQPYDWTLCSEPVARIIDPDTEEVVANLTWVPRADGTFAFTASRVDIAAAAGDRRVRPMGRDLAWMCEITIPGGNHVQLVASNSPFMIRHKGA